MATSFFHIPDADRNLYERKQPHFFQNRYFRMKVDIFLKRKFIKMISSFSTYTVKIKKRVENKCYKNGGLNYERENG